LTRGAYIKETHKTMNNIKNDVDVLDWAKMISDGKGEKYIPLGKGDMYVIAQFVLRNAQCLHNPPLVDENGEPKMMPPSSEQPATAVGTADPKPAIEEVRKPTPEETSCTSGGKDTTTATMMRSYALHRAGYTVQQAYDEFLKWSKEHPKEATVMDFSTGVKSNNAAFAYWLAEIISVEVPTTTTARI